MDPMQHLLRHRSASGGAIANLWELDDKDDRLLVCIRVAEGPVVHLPLTVRSLRKRVRMRGEFGIWSVSSSGECWAVEHGCYDAHLDPPHPVLPPLSLLLTNAPEAVAERLYLIALR